VHNQKIIDHQIDRKEQGADQNTPVVGKSRQIK